MRQSRPFPILMADDDPDDRLLTQRAFDRAHVRNELHLVEDGVELLAFLNQEGRYADAPRPGLILLDLNMPRMDGKQTLSVLKASDSFRVIPVVVLTTSSAEEDIVRSYDLGAASYITKPVTFERFVEAMRSLRDYWVEFVEIPN